MNDRLQTSSLTEHAIESIRGMILGGEFQPGAYLPTRKELAERLGVGTSTIHEAIQGLASLGLVDSRPGKGTWVRADALDTVFHPQAVITRLGSLDPQVLHETRAVLEVALGEFAAQRATPEDLDRMQTALAGMQAAMGDVTSFLDADMEFHMAVAAAAHNDLLEQLYRLLRKLLWDISEELIVEPAVREASFHHHVRVGEAILGRDAEGVRSSTLEHLEYVRVLLLERAARSVPSISLQ